MGEQQFWEQLKQKYEEKNEALQQREQELRLKLEAMDTIIGESSPRPPVFTPPPPAPPARIQSSPPENPGFFKGLFSMFSAKPPPPDPCACSPEPQRSPSPPPRAPQDMPIKESKVIPVKESVAKLTQTKNPGCKCDPCALDELVKQDNDSCNCSICSKVSFGDGTNRKVCPCTLVPSDDLCECNLDEVELAINTARDKVQQKAVVAKGLGSSAPSKYSLKSMDLHYMQNIQDLAVQQKSLLKDISQLEQKTKIYENVFAEYKNIDFSPKNRCCKNDAVPPDPNEKSCAELKLENFLLKNELKDMRLEIRQHLERMEGPMQFKIESERYKVLQMEKKLEESEREHRKLIEFFEREINALKMDLCTANTSNYNLNAANVAMSQALQDMQNKCAQLEENLIRQKISEADTIRSLQAALNARDGNVKEECQLHNIARELSKILKECEPCGECMNLPEDLTAAAKLLKSLTDLIDIKLNMVDKDENVVTNDEGAKVRLLEEVAMPGVASCIEECGKEEIPDGVVMQDLANDEEAEMAIFDVLVIDEVTNDDEGVQEEVLVAVSMQGMSGGSNLENMTTSRSNAYSSEVKTEGNGEPELEPDEPEAVPPPPAEDVVLETIPSVKSNPYNDQPSVSDVVPKKVEISETVSSLAQSKISCSCIKSKSKQIDQIWPKTDKPVALTESEVLDTPVEPTKKLCDCRIAKKLRESAGKNKETSGTPTRKQLCSCDSKSQPPEPVDGAEEIAPGALVSANEGCTTERFKLMHQVTASRSRDLLKSETNVKCWEENFPFAVDTKVDVINKPPDGVHVTTTITDSGTLEVITEGPEGLIETTLVYTKSGNVEVVTEILKYSGKDKQCKKLFSVKAPDRGALEAPLTGTAENPNCFCNENETGPGEVNPNCLCEICPDPLRGMGQVPEVQPTVDVNTEAPRGEGQINTEEVLEETGHGEVIDSEPQVEELEPSLRDKETNPES